MLRRPAVAASVRRSNPPPGSPEEAPPSKSRIAFIDIGRALSALLVFYAHVAHVKLFPGEDIPQPAYFGAFDVVTGDPLGFPQEGVGEIAVAFFFLVSGFSVTPVAVKLGWRRFVVNRFFRIFPVMAFVVLVTALAAGIGANIDFTPQSNAVTPFSVLTNIFAANYLIFPQVVLVPTAWTLIIELLFYVLLTTFAALLRRHAWLAIALELAIVLAVMLTRSDFGASYSLLGVNVSYLPLLLSGQIIWAATSKRMPGWLGAVYLAAAWCLYVGGDIIDVGRANPSYNLAFAFALGAFAIGYFAEPRLRERKLWLGLSERTYSLYLLHVLVCYGMLELLLPHLPYTPAMLIGVVVTFAVVEVSYRCVERPAHQLGRKLSRRRKQAAVASSGGAPPGR